MSGLKKTRVLLADDDAEVREVIKRSIMAHYGDSVQLVESVDGLDASNRIHLQAFDLILTDLNMPKRTGHWFIDDLRKSQYNAKTPVIVITGFASDYDLSGFKFVSLLEKPFRSKQLVEEMDRQLKLGNTDTRLSSNVINYFVEACLVYLREVLKQKPELKKPTVAQGDKSLSGDYTCILEMSGKTATGKFTLSYDESFLTYSKNIFAEKNEIFKSISMIKMAESLSKFIFDLINKRNIVPDDTFVLDKIESKSTEDIKSSGVLSKSKGILIEITTENGNIFAQALTS